MVYYCICQTPLGEMILAQQQGELVAARFDGVPEKDWQPAETGLLCAAKQQLEEYFQGTRRTFSLPLAPKGTPFQQKVWAALQTIPYGQTSSYGSLARQVGSPRGARAVGMANHCNPIAVFIPCHRVVGQNGALTGYAGGIWRKEALLKMEAEFAGGFQQSPQRGAETGIRR